MYFGKKIIISNNLDVAQAYHDLAEKDYNSANILCKYGMFNESAYLYIQSMEKYVKEQICYKVDSTNKGFAKLIRETGHSLDNSLELLIKIYCGNDINAKKQIEDIFLKKILKDSKFQILNNSLRYPNFSLKHNNYTICVISRNDCEILKKMTDLLKVALNDLYKIK